MKAAVKRIQLPTSDPVEAVARFVTGFTHNIKSPLTGVRGYGEMIGREDDRARRAYWSQRLMGGLESLDLMIEGVRRYQLPTSVTPQRVSARNLVRSAWCIAAQITSGARARNLQLVNSFAADVELTVDPLHYRNLLVNLLQNAIDASPVGAAVRVQPGTGAEVLSVRDSGDGLHGLSREQITQPFFTTRSDRAGLGLAVATQIAALHDQRMEWIETDAAGLTVRIVTGQATGAKGVCGE
ncbi:MAG: HAMP domain-containing histidine kinase [bacterium]|nr:HAMP domain-containing histidine kinase [bacterium]